MDNNVRLCYWRTFLFLWAYMEKVQAYKWIKVAGFLSFIPVVLVAGPFSGYIAGDFLVGKFKLPSYAVFICIGLGFAASITETIRIIKAAIKMQGEG